MKKSRAMRKPSAAACLLAGLLLLPAVTVMAADSGEKIATQGASQPGAVACASCHGPRGGGNEQSGFPRLAGLDAAYIEKQLYAFRDGKIQNPVMSGMARPLTDADIKAVAAYYASLPPVSNARVPAGVSPQDGYALAVYGDMTERGLPACEQCHGPGGQGVGSAFPPLAGQPHSYILAQIKAWRGGTRGGDPLGLMKSVADMLTDQEASEAAAWFAAIKPAASQKDTAVAAGPVDAASKPSHTPEDAGTSTAAVPAHHGEVETSGEAAATDYFTSPAYEAYPEGPLGEQVRLGEAIFKQTNTHSVSAAYVGNRQVCQGCHLDGGRLANSAPMWASWVAYPAYRNKTKSVNTLIERVQGCFSYSMNAQGSAAGKPPTAESDTMIALISYMYWLSTGAPTGDTKMPGRGYVKLKETSQGFDPERGAAVYKEKCAVCHGAEGEGQFAGAEVVFPPLWGPDSYNWGAGMHRINTAAAYIKFNMPVGLARAAKHEGWLTDQEAWDVAAYMNAQERPQDPRYTGDLAETTKKFHGSKYDYYGKRKKADGKLLGEDAPVK